MNCADSEVHITGIFFADVLGIYDVYKGNGPALSSGAQIPHLDVAYMVPAMAAVRNEMCVVKDVG